MAQASLELALEMRIVLTCRSSGITGLNHHTQLYTVLEIDPKASCMLDKHSTAEIKPWPLTRLLSSYSAGRVE